MARDNRPPYLKIAARIRADILSGALPRGSRLPSKERLIQRYGSGIIEIREALSHLRDEGLLIAHLGRVERVTDRPPLILKGGTNFKPDSREIAYRLLTVTEVDPPAAIAELLRLEVAEKTVLRKRVGFRIMLFDGYPFEMSRSYYPSSVAAGTALAESRLNSGELDVLAELGYEHSDVIERVSARMPTSEELTVLALPGEMPVLRQLRVVFSRGRPVEVTEMIKPGHLSESEYHQPVAG
ncbi:MAG TPA: GntR family transcriptional regulator [Amycolatopsis sp.]|jgi:GntR family transcriptional regulator|nr:GntR family transcriptional regulator [Amycolatopsis sp.]